MATESIMGCVGPQQPAVGELFQQLSLSDQDELLFIQLPDAIPGQPASTSTETSAKKDSKSDDKHPGKLKTQVKYIFLFCSTQLKIKCIPNVAHWELYL